jgi:hypothetical protein
MKLMRARLSPDWEQNWGHPLALAETFVGPHLYQGTAYKASGWQRLGPTVGWKRSAEDFYQKHDRPKQIWVRELVVAACRKLGAQELPPNWQPVEEKAAPRCLAKAPPMRSLVEPLARPGAGLSQQGSAGLCRFGMRRHRPGAIPHQR